MITSLESISYMLRPYLFLLLPLSLISTFPHESYLSFAVSSLLLLLLSFQESVFSVKRLTSGPYLWIPFLAVCCRTRAQK